MDLDAQYSHDIEQAIALSKESAKEEMDEGQAIAESKAFATENEAGAPKIAVATMAQSDEAVEILEGLPSKGSATEQMKQRKAIEEPQALSAGNSSAELERSDEEREESEEAAMMTVRSILSEGYVVLTCSPSVAALLHPPFPAGGASFGDTESTPPFKV